MSWVDFIFIRERKKLSNEQRYQPYFQIPKQCLINDGRDRQTSVPADLDLI